VNETNEPPRTADEAGPDHGGWRNVLSPRLALAVLTLAVLGGLAYLTVSADGFIRRAEWEREKDKLENEIAVLRDENQVLRRKIEHLRQDPGYVEDEARRKLGLIRPGETIYRLSEESDLAAEDPGR
jgi:cell division protein FtsB